MYSIDGWWRYTKVHMDRDVHDNSIYNSNKKIKRKFTWPSLTIGLVSPCVEYYAEILKVNDVKRSKKCLVLQI